jgi:hypothetical protein
MTDNITLRRAAEQARSALSGWANHGLWAWPESALQTCKQNTEEALAALDAALAEPEQKPEPVAWLQVGVGVNDGDFIARTSKPKRWNSEWWRFEPLYTHPPATVAEPDAKREPVAFAKNGNLFWCGDASQMRGVDIDLYLAPPQPDAKREPATDEQVHKWYWDNNLWGLRHAEFRYGWRAAERFHGIRKEDT